MTHHKPELTLTNYNKWLHYMSEVGSPENFITFGFYAMIAAALQRRVWYEKGTVNCYPNMFCILVGAPGIGKGRVITQVSKMLKHHKLKRKNPFEMAQEGDVEGALEEAMQSPSDSKLKLADAPLLFPMPAESTSLRALTNHLAKAFRRIQAKLPDGTTKVYSHSSSVFVLEELSSLIKHQSETKLISDFLLCAWDCGDYRHETYGNGIDNIRKTCVSLIAGTTPKFMQETFDDSLVGEGLTARTLFIYENTNRFWKWVSKPLTESQEQAYTDLTDHLLSLSELYGPIRLTPDADEYLKFWYEEEQHKHRVNPHYRLDYYYARKDMHILKLAAAIHFAESLTMEVNLNEILHAMQLLAEAEKKMHLALSVKGKNVLAIPSKLICIYLRKAGPMTESELAFEFNDEVNMLQLKEILQYLTTTKQVKAVLEGSKTKYVYNKTNNKEVELAI